jgi:hypothetical protein
MLRIDDCDSPLHDGLEVIGEGAFYECTALHEIVVPPTVKSIKFGAFRECSRLTTATLLNGLEEIGKYAFYNCPSLQGITIPPAVKMINDGTFSGC